MSDTSQGPGWWQASDGKWYPPEQAPGYPRPRRRAGRWRPRRWRRAGPGGASPAFDLGCGVHVDLGQVPAEHAAPAHPGRRRRRHPVPRQPDHALHQQLRHRHGDAAARCSILGFILPLLLDPGGAQDRPRRDHRHEPDVRPRGQHRCVRARRHLLRAARLRRHPRLLHRLRRSCGSSSASGTSSSSTARSVPSRPSTASKDAHRWAPASASRSCRCWSTCSSPRSAPAWATASPSARSSACSPCPSPTCWAPTSTRRFSGQPVAA